MVIDICNVYTVMGVDGGMAPLGWGSILYILLTYISTNLRINNIICKLIGDDIMNSHELAKLLLAMPDEIIFVQTDNGSFNIKEVKLCGCECEIFIYMEDF